MEIKEGSWSRLQVLNQLLLLLEDVLKFSPSEDLSLATQEFSSVTVLSSRVHSFRRMSTFFTHSSLTALTLTCLSLRAATSASASACVVIFWAAPLAASRTLA